jgi:WD40 repeat protein
MLESKQPSFVLWYQIRVNFLNIIKAQAFDSTNGGHSAIIYDLVFYSATNILASSSFDDSIKIWNLSSSLKSSLMYTFNASNGGPTDYVGTALAAIYTHENDTTLLASGGDDYVVKIWDLNLGKLKYSFNQTNGGHSRPILELTSIKNSKYLLASCSSDNTIKIWNLTSGVLKFTFNVTSVRTIAFIEDNLLASGDDRENFFVNIFNLTSMTLKYSLSEHSGRISRLISLKGNGTGDNLLASGSYDGSVNIWNLTNGSLKFKLNGSGSPSVITYAVELNWLAAGYFGDIRIWDLTSGQLKYELNLHTDIVDCLVFLNNATILVSGSWDHTVKVWNLSNGTLRYSFNQTNGGHTSNVYVCSLVGNGATSFGSGDNDGVIKLWKTFV